MLSSLACPGNQDPPQLQEDRNVTFKKSILSSLGSESVDQSDEKASQIGGLVHWQKYSIRHDRNDQSIIKIICTGDHYYVLPPTSSYMMRFHHVVKKMQFVFVQQPEVAIAAVRRTWF